MNEELAQSVGISTLVLVAGISVVNLATAALGLGGAPRPATRSSAA